MARLGFRHLYAVCVYLAFPVLISYFEVELYITLAVAFALWFGAFGLSKLAEVEDTSRSEEYPTLILNGTPGSHFVERLRWSLQYMEVPFNEELDAGILMAVVNGRTVPNLSIPGWRVHLGNSPDICRYLSAQCSLKPSSVSSEEWRRFWDPFQKAMVPNLNDLQGPWIEMDAMSIDDLTSKIGYSVQRVVFGSPFASKNVGFARQMWGTHLSESIPFYQRWPVWMMAPLLLPIVKGVMKATPQAVKDSENYLRKCAEWLSVIRKGDESLGITGRRFIMSDERPSHVDFAFAALMGILMVNPSEWAAGGIRNVPGDVHALSNADGFQSLVKELQTSEAGIYISELYSQYRKTTINGTAVPKV